MTGKNMSQEIIEVEGLRVLHTTDMAVYVTNGDIETWLPLSKIDIERDGGTISMPEWLAFKEGLI